MVSALLTGCAGVTVVAASREPLRLRGEHEIPVPPLPLPPPATHAGAQAMIDNPAVRLFEQQARLVAPGFTLDAENVPAVAEICRRLDGLPLAIELAAAHSKLLTPAALLSRMARRLDLQARAVDVPGRHRSLREAVAWSVERLPAAERAIFARLAVFAGGWSLEAAEAVCGDPPSRDVLQELGSLVDRSLVRREGTAGQERRFGMLETIREFALEELDAGGEGPAMRDRHAEHFLALCRDLEPGLFATRPSALGAVSREMDNIRAALRHFIDRGETIAALRLASAIRVHWVFSGQLTEGRRWMAEVLNLPGASEPSAAAASVRAALAGVAVRVRDANAEALAAEARLVARACRNFSALAHAHFMLGLCALARGDAAAGARQIAASRRVGRLAGQPYWEANAHAIAGLMLRRRGQPVEADHAFARALELHRANGHLWGVARTLSFWSTLALERGQLERACNLARGSLLADQQLGSVQVDAECFETLAAVLAATGHLEPAARLLGVVASLREAQKTPLAGAEEEAAARTMALGEDACHRAFAAGQALPVPQAMAGALAASEPVFARRRAGRAPGVLTARELQVAGLIARGMTSREIAEALTVSERTVDTHVDRIRNRLGLRSRAEIASWAGAQGLYRPPER